jgi:outer membrane receptor protein involved in Fe transport
MARYRIFNGASLAALTVAAFAGLTVPALAQDAAPAADTVDSIIVTAQKREQNLQDVPIVITTISGKLLQASGVKDIKDLQILTPGLNVTSTTNETSTTARIRGVGTVGDNSGLESSVGVVIDGVYRPRNGVAYNDLGEMSRIEVLKGPQGTLFGKNTSAGVINVITAAPTFTTHVKGEVTIGNYDQKGGAISVNGALIPDEVAGSLYLATRKRQGFYNVLTGAGPRTQTDDNDSNFVTARGQLLITPNSDATIRIIGDYTNRYESCCAAVSIKRGVASQLALDAATPGGSATALVPDPYARVSRANRSNAQKISDHGLSAEANIDLGAATLTSITAFRDWSSTNALDLDFSTSDFGFRTPDSNTHFATLTQELRLAGRSDKMDWLVGGFFSSERLHSGQDFRYGSTYEQYIGRLISQGIVGGAGAPNFVAALLGRAPGTSFALNQGQQDNYSQSGKSAALFTNNTFHATDRFDVTLGLRFTHEAKDLGTVYANTDSGVACATGIARAQNGALPATLIGLGVPAAAVPGALSSILGALCVPSWANPNFNSLATSQKQTDNDLSGALRASYRFSPELMTYVSYARGFKAGGFNLDRTQGGALAPTLPLPIVPNLNTAFAAETVDAYEAGFKSTLFDRSLLFNATAFNSEYSHFQLNAFNGISFTVVSVPKVKSYGIDSDFLWFTPAKGLTLQGGLTWAVTQYGKDNVPGFPNLRNGRLSGAPMFSGSLAVDYQAPVTGTLKVLANLSAKYTSSQNTGSDLDPAKVQGEYTLVNGRIGLGSLDNSWSIEAFAANLLDKDYMQVAFGAPLQAGAYDAFLGAPRTYGVTLRAGF